MRGSRGQNRKFYIKIGQFQGLWVLASLKFRVAAPRTLEIEFRHLGLLITGSHMKGAHLTQFTFMKYMVVAPLIDKNVPIFRKKKL